MFDYKKVLNSENFDDIFIEITHSDNLMSLVGNENGLLYLASRIIKYVDENDTNTYFDL